MAPLVETYPQGDDGGAVQPDYDGRKRRLPEEDGESDDAQSGGDPAPSGQGAPEQRIKGSSFGISTQFAAYAGRFDAKRQTFFRCRLSDRRGL